MWGIFGAIVGAIVGAVVVAATAVSAAIIAPAVIAGATIGVVACVVNAFNICPPSSPSAAGGGSGATVIGLPINVNKGNNGGNNSSNNNNWYGSSGQLCTGTAKNACGKAGSAFVKVCDAATKAGIAAPANSSCPAPVISGTGFYASPTLVKSGGQSTLYWNVTNATTCAITGGGLNLPGLPLSSNHLTGSITQKTTYTLTCQNGANGGPSASANATVNLIPAFQEI